jgi:hypothetical protein
LLAAKRLGQIELAARHAWLTQSAHPDYYRDFPDAKKKLDEARESYLDGLARFGADDAAPLGTRLMLENNKILLGATGGLKTADYVDHLRTIAPDDHTHYVSRATQDLGSLHPFTEATITILAPEEDTTRYYGRYKAPKLYLEGGPDPDAAAAATGVATATNGAAAAARAAARLAAAPPTGVDAGAFFDLMASRDRAVSQGLAEIDRAANNTSLVLLIEWRGWRLLFPGDAEERSWKTMNDQGLLQPVHFIKVSHHGSVNGTVPEIFSEVLLPDAGDADRPRRAAVSTHDDQWESVPDHDTLGFYTGCCTELFDTRSIDPGASLEIRFPG